MNIDVALVPDEGRVWQNTVSIVIDVLRASSTIVTLFEKGGTAVYPFKSIQEAQQFAQTHQLWLGGERDALKPAGFNFKNSPFELSRMSFQGKELVLTTTNGTAVIEGVQHAGPVLIGSLLNASACCQKALQLALENDLSIGILCAGSSKRFTLDDCICAGVLVEELQRLKPSCVLSNAAVAARRIYRSYDSILEGFLESRSGKRIIEIGDENDVSFCTQINTSQIVPTLVSQKPLKFECAS